MQTYMVGKAALNNGNGNDSYIVAGLERASNWTGLILSRAWEAGRVPPIERYFANQHDQMDLANNVFLMLHVGASSSGHYILLHYQRDAHVGRVIQVSMIAHIQFADTYSRKSSLSHFQATPCPEVTEALGAQNLLFNAVFGEISRLAPNFLTIVHVKIDVVGADKKDYACCGPLAVCALKHFLRFPRSSEKTLVVQQCRKTAIISLKNVLRDCFSKGIILEDTEAEEDEEIILEDTEAEEDELANTKLLCYLDDADFLEEIEQLH